MINNLQSLQKERKQEKIGIKSNIIWYNEFQEILIDFETLSNHYTREDVLKHCIFLKNETYENKQDFIKQFGKYLPFDISDLRNIQKFKRGTNKNVASDAYEQLCVTLLNEQIHINDKIKIQSSLIGFCEMLRQMGVAPYDFVQHDILSKTNNSTFKKVFNVKKKLRYRRPNTYI